MRPVTWLCLNSLFFAIRILQRLELFMATRSGRTKYHVRVSFSKDYNPETVVEYIDLRYKTAQGALNRAMKDFDAYEIEVRPVADAYYRAEFMT